MKKVVTFLLIFFIGIVGVNAESLKCTYSVGGVKLVVSYKTGDKGLTTKVEGQGSAYVKIDTDLVLTNFRNENGELTCLSSLYDSKKFMYIAGTLITQYYITSQYTDIGNHGLINSESSVENDEKPKDDTPEDEIITCSYTDKTVKYKVVFYYNKTKNKIDKTEATNGCIFNNSILKPNDFKNGCPSSDRYKLVWQSDGRGNVVCTLNDQRGQNVEEPKTEPNATEIEDKNNQASGGNHLPGAGLKLPSKTGFGNTGDSCSSVLGPTLTALVKEAVKWVRIAGAIIAIVNGMLKLIPAIMSKDAEALNKAFRTCITMAIILVFCLLFDWLLGFIGSIFKWDVSCVV